MINKLEIADLARELSLDLHVVEKDYVLGWLLAGIAANPDFSECSLRWLYGAAQKPVFDALAVDQPIDILWQPPSMVYAWGKAVPLESIRFAAANHLCVNLRYQNTWRLIEPYSLRRSLDGNFLLCAVKSESGESRSYRIDRIQGIEVSKTPFNPRYQIELTPAG
nr:WYL domain-containing protein [Oxalobacteraceae bacterium]